MELLVSAAVGTAIGTVAAATYILHLRNVAYRNYYKKRLVHQ